jgi:uncharacterized protein with PIN domain
LRRLGLIPSLLIWGSKGREKTVTEGQFFCPNCNELRPYKLKKLGKYFTIYFVPLFQTEKLAEWVECQACGQQLKPKVLEYRPPSTADRAIEAIRADLDNGTPAMMAVRKLVNMGLEEQMAMSAVALAIENPAKLCPRCELHYRRTVHRCSMCGGPLRDLYAE